MKNLFTTALLALCALHLTAQIRDHALAYGFHTGPRAISPLTDDRWLVIGQGQEQPGAPFTDTTFALVFNAAGELLLQQKLTLPAEEQHIVNGAVGTPDGGFIVATEKSYCDALWLNLTLQKFGADGQLTWEKYWDEPALWHPILRAAPDGNLLGFANGNVFKIDAATGVILWQIALTVPTGNYWRDVALLPGTEDFAALGFHSYQIWRQTGAPGDPAYTLTFTEPMPMPSSAEQVVAGPDGWCYALSPSSGRLVRFNDAEGFETLATFDWKPYALASMADGLLLLGRDGAENMLQKVDFTGQITGSLLMPDHWLQGQLLATRGGDVLVAGIDQSGPATTDFIHSQASGLWARVFSPASVPNNHPNIGVTAVEQNGTITIASFLDGCGMQRYNLDGGNFRVQVTNFGTVPVEKLDVRTAFNWVDGICFRQPVERRHYDNLWLLPGESLWFDFGDIQADYQTSVPEQFCFWTSNPDDQPDRMHENDTHCQSIALAGGGAAESAAPRLFPNPAGSAGFWAELPSENPATLAYQLSDATGSLVSKGQFAAGQRQAFVPAATLPAGLYFFQAGKWRGKVVVER